MPSFSERKGGYKVGVILLAITTVVFIIGFAAPYWKTTDKRGAGGKTTYNEGLWMYCIFYDWVYASAGACTIAGVVGHPDWFQGVRAVECLCLIGLILACIIALATNCMCASGNYRRNRILEILAGFSGVMGFLGCMLYLGYLIDNNNDDTMAIQNFPIDAIRFGLVDASFDWAFYMAAVGSGLSVVAAIIIAIFNVEIQPTVAGYGTSGGRTVIAMSNVHYQQQQQQQPYGQGHHQGQGYYGHQPGYGYPAASAPVKAGYY